MTTVWMIRKLKYATDEPFLAKADLIKETAQKITLKNVKVLLGKSILEWMNHQCVDKRGLAMEFFTDPYTARLDAHAALLKQILYKQKEMSAMLDAVAKLHQYR
jgi:hypothetical protein